ncbi:MAG: hypothetical protein ACE5J2_04005 [Nitrososphaerales archaeon]
MAVRGSAVKIIGIAGGIGAAVIIGIIVYGELSRPAGEGILQQPTEQWAVGNSLEPNTTFKYKLSHADNNYQELIVTFNFEKHEVNGWHVFLEVEDTSKPTEVTEDLLMSSSLIPTAPISVDLQPYMKMIQGSILWITDYAVEPKFLAGGASWGTITHGLQTQQLRITSIESISTEAGSFDSYVLSYSIQDKESRLWIVADQPLPVKGEVYGADGNLQFKFESIQS